MTTETVDRAVRARRALEALRAGVPNRDAVVELGSMQIGVEDRFAGILDGVGSSAGQSPGAPSDVTAALVTSRCVFR
jgi:hypothetical protein